MIKHSHTLTYTQTHTHVLTLDRGHTALRTQCRVGKSCRTHTGWALGPSSPPRTVCDKHAPVSLKTHTETEKLEHNAHCTYSWPLHLEQLTLLTQSVFSFVRAKAARSSATHSNGPWHYYVHLPQRSRSWLWLTMRWGPWVGWRRLCQGSELV